MGFLGAVAFVVILQAGIISVHNSSDLLSETDSNSQSIKPLRPVLSFQSWREQFIVKKLLSKHDYKNSVRPFGRNVSAADGGPVIVDVSVVIQSITSINDAQMEFSSQLRFQQSWLDNRLRYDHMGFDEIQYVHLKEDQHPWIPDTFFQNEKRGHYHMIDKPNRAIKVASDGRIYYNTRLSMVFACTMQLSRYPHDTQICQIDFASYAYTTSDIVYLWNKLLLTPGPLRPKFSIVSYENKSCTSKTNTGEYSCLRVELELKRTFSFFFLQLYVPSFMLVGVSCVSYWIDWKSSPARVPLSIVTLLAMITQSHAINSSLPPVSYTKAIDLWIGACIIFIFCSLIEYAIVNYIGVSEERRKAKLLDHHNNDDGALYNLHSLFANNVAETAFTFGFGGQAQQQQAPDEQSSLIQQLPAHDYEGEEQKGTRRRQRQSYLGINTRVEPATMDDFATNFHRQRQLRRRFQKVYGIVKFLKSKSTAERIDIISRMLFPLSFLCFNCVYWILYW